MNDEPIAAREAAHVRSGSPDPLPAVSPLPAMNDGPIRTRNTLHVRSGSPDPLPAVSR
jgi:hypothetical protein